MGIGLESAARRWGALQAKAHLPEVQGHHPPRDRPRHVSRRPRAGRRDPYHPSDGGMVEKPEPAAHVVHEHGQTHSEPALHIRRTTS
jgi:hypothetical protein